MFPSTTERVPLSHQPEREPPDRGGAERERALGTRRTLSRSTGQPAGSPRPSGTRSGRSRRMRRASRLWGRCSERRWTSAGCFSPSPAVTGFLLQHAVQGSAPASAYPAALGLPHGPGDSRSERNALKALRGDYGPIGPGTGDHDNRREPCTSWRRGFDSRVQARATAPPSCLRVVVGEPHAREARQLGDAASAP